jgi:hypothetical protein
MPSDQLKSNAQPVRVYGDDGVFSFVPTLKGNRNNRPAKRQKDKVERKK